MLQLVLEAACRYLLCLIQGLEVRPAIQVEEQILMAPLQLASFPSL